MNTVRFKFQSEICDLKSEINMMVLELVRFCRHALCALRSSYDLRLTVSKGSGWVNELQNS